MASSQECETSTVVIRPFGAPGSTHFDNVVLDYIMPRISGNAWKVLSFVIRKTWGWEDKGTRSGRKEADTLAYSQIKEGTGIRTNTTIARALDELVDLDHPERGYLLRSPSKAHHQSFDYRLNVGLTLTIRKETSPENGQVSGGASPENGQVKSDTCPENRQVNEETSPENRQVSGKTSPENRHTKESIKEKEFKETSLHAPGGAWSAAADPPGAFVEASDDEPLTFREPPPSSPPRNGDEARAQTMAALGAFQARLDGSSWLSWPKDGCADFWQRQPEEVRRAGHVLACVTGLAPPPGQTDKKALRSWASGLAEVVRECNGDFGLLEKALRAGMERLREEKGNGRGISLKGPRSVVFMLANYRAEQNRQEGNGNGNRPKYYVADPTQFSRPGAARTHEATAPPGD